MLSVNIYCFNDFKLFNDLVLGIIDWEIIDWLLRNGHYGLLKFIGWRIFWLPDPALFLHLIPYAPVWL